MEVHQHKLSKVILQFISARRNKTHGYIKTFPVLALKFLYYHILRERRERAADDPALAVFAPHRNFSGHHVKIAEIVMAVFCLVKIQ